MRGRFPTTIAYDVDLKRPGCVIVAAGLGADTGPCQAFDSKYWLLHPTPGMRVYPLENQAQLDHLVTVTSLNLT